MGFKVLLQEQNKDVARKLGIATGLMFTFPFIVYYLCFFFLFAHKEEPSAWSGFAAVGAANVVVFGYVYSAFSEPDDDLIGVSRDGENDNDASGPRVGAFKQRTD
mmetsp:Transcript_15159/g.22192  ORF Transcript_15159/g.22192 Transcript_15159/m.22192 type:complete len:105 (+) Transcript_15159:93-407(+)